MFPLLSLPATVLTTCTGNWFFLSLGLLHLFWPLLCLLFLCLLILLIRLPLFFFFFSFFSFFSTSSSFSSSFSLPFSSSSSSSSSSSLLLLCLLHLLLLFLLCLLPLLLHCLLHFLLLCHLFLLNLLFFSSSSSLSSLPSVRFCALCSHLSCSHIPAWSRWFCFEEVYGQMQVNDPVKQKDSGSKEQQKAE